jgi:hypothetical protein
MARASARPCTFIRPVRRSGRLLRAFYGNVLKVAVWRVAASLAARRPRRTGLGALHHPAPSLRHPPRGWVEVMNNPRTWQVWTDTRVEAGPCHAAPLTAAVQPFEQEAAGVVKIPLHAPEVATDPIVLDVALEMSNDILQHGFPPFDSQLGEMHVQCLQLPT